MSEQRPTATEEQFSNTPAGWAKRLQHEFTAARKALETWHKEAEAALKAYLDERDAAQSGDMHWPIYTSDSQTQEAMLYGQTPRVCVSRRFSDAADDVARVAGEIQERILNADIEDDGDTFAVALECANMDRQHVGLGVLRVRYEMGETEEDEGKEPITRPGPDGTPVEAAPAVPAIVRRPDECAETDYIHWKDFLWSSSRVWHEVEWVAFRAQMSQKQLAAKFGEDVAADLPKSGASKGPDGKPVPWARTDVWEVWVKEEKAVFFYVENHPEVLAPVGIPVLESGGVEDPLGLEGFWPCPRPMFANVTTSKLVPKADYTLAKDLYEEVNDLSTRIRMLEQALRAVGMYDKSNTELKHLLTSGRGNEMVPVANWAALAEKGGIRGAVDWFPLEQVVSALTVLREYRAEQVDALRQITGMSDIMRGQASTGGVTATEQAIKARFGSVRMQRREKELARFASDTQKLRAEIMAKHFDESTILARSNCEKTPDANLALEAVKLIKSDFAKYRIEVKPESIAMADFEAIKSERTEMLGAIAQYLQVAGPLAQQTPAAAGPVLQLLQWLVSGLRGASEIESVLDQAVAAAQQAAQQPQQQSAAPDPKLQQIQAKSQADMQKAQLDHALDVDKIRVEVAAENAKQQAQTEWNVKEQMAKHAMKPLAPPPNGRPVP